MASISVRVGIRAGLFLGTTNPPTPFDTTHAVHCNKAKFRVHRRHAAGGVCEQRITALRKNIHRYVVAGWWMLGTLTLEGQQ